MTRERMAHGEALLVTWRGMADAECSGAQARAQHARPRPCSWPVAIDSVCTTIWRRTSWCCCASDLVIDGARGQVQRY